MSIPCLRREALRSCPIEFPRPLGFACLWSRLQGCHYRPSREAIGGVGRVLGICSVQRSPNRGEAMIVADHVAKSSVPFAFILTRCGHARN